MENAWEILGSGGVPIGAPRSDSHFDWNAGRAALNEVMGSAIPDAYREPLLGWFDALAQHWPHVYARELSRLAPLHRKLERQYDANRRLKFRRIAAAKLSRLI